MATSYPLSIILGAVDRLSGPLAGAERRLGKFGRAATAAGKKLTLGLTAPTIALGAVALTSFARYESGMLRVQALTGASTEQIAKLETQTKSLGKTTVFTAGEVAGAQGFLAQAGFKVNEVLAATPGVLDLASAAQMDLAETADIASNVLTGYGKTAADINDVNNILVRTFTNSNTSLEQLGESMKLAGPVAAAMGIPMEETAAILGKLGDAGFQGSLGGTAVRGALAKLAKPAAEAAAAMSRLGIKKTDILDTVGNVKSLTGAVEILQEKGATAGDMLTIFGLRAGPAMTSLVQQGARSIRELRGEIEEGTTAARIAEIQNSGLAGKMALLKSATEGLAIAVAESGLLEWFSSMVVKTTELIGKLAETNPRFLKMATVAIGAAAALGPLLILVGQASLGISGLASAVQFMAPLLKGMAMTLTRTLVPAVWSFTTALLANPIGLIVAGVAALIGGLVLLAKKNDTVREALTRAWGGIQAAFEFMVQVITGGFRALVHVFETLGKFVGFDGPDQSFSQAVTGQAGLSGGEIASAVFAPVQNKSESKVILEIPNLPAGARVTADDLDESVELALGFTLEGA